MSLQVKKTYKGYQGKLYLPPDQVSYVAKFYKGLNLNVRLTLIDEDPLLPNVCIPCDCCKALGDQQPWEAIVPVGGYPSGLTPEQMKWGIPHKDMTLLEGIRQWTAEPGPDTAFECPPCTYMELNENNPKDSRDPKSRGQGKTRLDKNARPPGPIRSELSFKDLTRIPREERLRQPAASSSKKRKHRKDHTY